MSWLLWMEVQIKVDPDAKPRGFMITSHESGLYNLGDIDLKDVRVDQVLNEMVRRRRAAAWILLPSPKTLKGADRDSLWGIVGY